MHQEIDGGFLSVVVYTWQGHANWKSWNVSTHAMDSSEAAWENSTKGAGPQLSHLRSTERTLFLERLRIRNSGGQSPLT